MNIAANLTAVVERALPALSGSNVTYNKQHNIYLSDAYTSAMGNTYYQGIRLSNRIIISYSIGEWANGSIGIITHLENDKIEVEFENGQKHQISRTTWENCNYKYNKDEMKTEKEVQGCHVHSGKSICAERGLENCR